MKCDVYDSDLTLAGTPRKVIYIGNCGTNLGKEAKRLAMIDFNAQKVPINQVEKIKPLKRPFTNHDYLSAGAKESNLEHQEYADLAVQYMRYIL